MMKGPVAWAGGSMSAREEIVKWANKQQPWLRTLLSMLAAGAEDYNSVVNVLLADPASVPDLEPLSFGPVTDSPEPRTLTGIRGIRHVRRLQPDGEVTFASAGLTVVHGPNGSGKSSYARLIARASGAREASRLPNRVPSNIYNGEPDDVATAQFLVQSSDGEVPISWRDGDPRQLDFVHVFTTSGQALYLDRGQLQFAPMGIDFASRIAPAIKQVRALLDERIQEVGEQLKKCPWKDFDWESPAGRFVRSIEKMNPDPADLEAVLRFTETDQQRLDELGRLLDEAPVAPLDSKLESLSTIEGLARRISGAVDNTQREAIAIAGRAARQARATADEIGRSSFEGEPLADVGGPEWRALYTAARAFVGTKRLTDTPGDLCGLCLQPLSHDARERMRRFDEFVMGHINQAAEQAEADYRRVVADALAAPWDPLTEQTLPDLGEAFQNVLTAFQQAAYRCHRTLLELRDKPPSTSIALELDASALLEQIAEARSQIEADRLRRQHANQAESRAELMDERARLRAKERLGSCQDWLVQRLTDLRAQQQMYERRRSVTTTPATHLLNRLQKEYLKPAVKASFEEELAQLRVTSLKVDLTASTRQGRIETATDLTNAQQSIGIREVLSEGEGKAVALAAFLCEAQLSPSCTCLVLDDPMSSMDRERSERLAARLVKEAERRQVIVFTHDVVFLTELVAHATDQNSLYQVWKCSALGPFAGLIDDGGIELAKGKSLNEALDELNRRCKRLAGDASLEPTSRDEQARSLAREARLVFERIIEQSILGDVVSRYRRKIHVGNLDNLRITLPLLPRVKELHTELSRYHHDDGLGAGCASVDPSDVKKLVQQLVDLRDEVSRARKQRKAQTA